jgi:hypothetical protein
LVICRHAADILVLLHCHLFYSRHGLPCSFLTQCVPNLLFVFALLEISLNFYGKLR